MKTFIIIYSVLKWEQFFLSGKMKHLAIQEIGFFVFFFVWCFDSLLKITQPNVSQLESNHFVTLHNKYSLAPHRVQFICNAKLFSSKIFEMSLLPQNIFQYGSKETVFIKIVPLSLLGIIFQKGSIYLWHRCSHNQNDVMSRWTYFTTIEFYSLQRTSNELYRILTQI